ncbi:hypothetical protein RFI_11797, partial [Reticulomyxa filosa]
FKASRVYKYCVSVIRRPVLFDIWPAINSLNTRNTCVTLEELHLVDVRCSKKEELKKFLENNYNHLHTIVLQYTEACLQSHVNEIPNSQAKGGDDGTEQSINPEQKQSKRNKNVITAKEFPLSGNAPSQSNGGNSSSSNPKKMHSLQNLWSKNSAKMSKYVNDQVSMVNEFLQRCAQHQKKRNIKQGYFQKFALENMAIILPSSGLRSDQLPALRSLFETLSQECKCLKEQKQMANSISGNFIDESGEAKQKMVGDDDAPQLSRTALFNAIDIATHDPMDQLSHTTSLSRSFSCMHMSTSLPDCDAFVQLDKLYLSGLLSSFEFSESINWTKMLQTQKIKQLIIKNVLYHSKVFASFAQGFSGSVVRLDLQLQFEEEVDPSQDVDERTSIIGSILHSNDSKKKQQPVKEMFSLLSQCQCLEYLTIEFIQHPRSKINVYLNNNRGLNRPLNLQRALSNEPRKNPSSFSDSNNGNSHDDSNAIPRVKITGNTLLLEPVIDITWIDAFVRSPNIKKTLKALDIRLNELSMKHFENKHKDIPKFKTFQQSQGKIIRINNEFCSKLEELLQQWFRICRNLWSIRLIRRLTNIIVFGLFFYFILLTFLCFFSIFFCLIFAPPSPCSSQFDRLDDDEDEEKVDNKKVDFADKSPFHKWSVPAQVQSIVHFGMIKFQDPQHIWKINVYGALKELLMPEMPLGG